MQPKKSSLAVTLALATFAVILLATSIRANAEKVLYSFQGGSDGSYPTAGLIADKAGNLYGTTAFGGSGACHSRGELGRQTGCGTVFELSPAGDGTWTEKIIYSFQGQQDGSYPYVGLTFDSTGNLYGTTAYGGGNATCVSIEYGCGVVFELTPGSGGDWTEPQLRGELLRLLQEPTMAPWANVSTTPWHGAGASFATLFEISAPTEAPATHSG